MYQLFIYHTNQTVSPRVRTKLSDKKILCTYLFILRINYLITSPQKANSKKKCAMLVPSGKPKIVL